MSSAVEHLHRAHRMAMSARHSRSLDAAALARSWPGLAAAARNAHRRLTGAAASTPSDGDRVVDRVGLHVGAAAQAQRAGGWPPPGRPDCALDQVTDALAAAAAVGSLDSPNEHLEASRLITSVLWSTSQLVGHLARDHSIDLRMGRGADDMHTWSLQAAGAKELSRQLGAVEQLTCGALRGHLGPEAAPTELRQAVASWDIEAHRALMSTGSTVILHALSHQQSGSVHALAHLVDQASTRGMLDPLTAERMHPALESASRSWGELRVLAGDLSFGVKAVPASLVDAATALHTALARTAEELTEQPAPAQPQTILSAVTSHLATAVSISTAARGLVAQHELHGPARAVARTLAEHREDLHPSLVDPRAIQQGRTVVLPPPVLDIVDRHLEQVLVATSAALDRSSGLGKPTTSTVTTDQSSDQPQRDHSHVSGPHTPVNTTGSTTTGPATTHLAVAMSAAPNLTGPRR